MAYPGQCEQQSAGCGLDFQYLALDEPPWVSLGGSCFLGWIKDEDGPVSLLTDDSYFMAVSTRFRPSRDVGDSSSRATCVRSAAV